MSEIIQLHIGQAGIQIGNSCWELFCLEHGIQPDGSMDAKVLKDHRSSETIFQETGKGIYTPRALFIDLEPTIIDSIRSGPLNIFHPENLISGNECAANNFARGYYTIGKQKLDVCLDRISRLAQNCDSLKGFIIYHSIAGGTGSGFASLLLNQLSIDYGKRDKVSFTVFPSPQLSTSVVEPYNAVLSTHSLVEHCDTAILLDNQAIYEICTKKLEIEQPSYLNVNRLIAQTVSSLTAALRFGGSLNNALIELYRDLVPYPRIHFLLNSFAPFKQRDSTEQSSVQQLTKTVFESENTLASCDPRLGKYLACTMLYRGDIAPNQVNAAIETIKNKQTIQFVDWCPTGFKVGINSQPSPHIPNGDLAKSIRSACMLSNTTAITQVFDSLARKFDLMHAKQAFVWWYQGEGMEDSEMREDREILEGLVKDYEEVGLESTLTREET